MKTITLDDAAYDLLKVWKRSPKESFSHAVKRLVPQPGTLGAFINFVEANDTPHLPGNDLLENAVELRSPIKADSWI